MIQYALCWDLKDGEEIFKFLFQKFQNIGSSTIYKNLYDYHVLEKPSLSISESKYIFNKIKNIDQLSWILYSFKISNIDTPRVSISLFLTPISLLKLFFRGYFRLPFYSLTIASHDTKIELKEDYKDLIVSFFRKNIFLKLTSYKISLIEYESGKWEKRIE